MSDTSTDLKNGFDFAGLAASMALAAKNNEFTMSTAAFIGMLNEPVKAYNSLKAFSTVAKSFDSIVFGMDLGL
ncbi:thrombospondin, partial [Francisella tularensis subsp. holarctica]|nr:thrombospondin [Francisella tularensis subsp. holarctica]